VRRRELIRLRGDEDWESWGGGWFVHVEKLRELSFIADRRSWPEAARERPSVELDWGAWMTELSRDELHGVLIEDLPIEHVQQAVREQHAFFDTLPADGRYGLVEVDDS
jgi:hypothetical protein